VRADVSPALAADACPAQPGLFDLTGNLAVVTGARRGIGLAIADALAAAGADIVAVSAQLEADGAEVARRVQARGRDCSVLRADLADRSAVAELAAKLAAWPRPVDILVNNAGAIARAPATQHSDADWDRVLQIDLTSQFVLAREIGRTMLARRHGKIVFTASLLSFQGGINVPGYTAAKSGVAGLTRALANEWAGSGVNVNAIVPGYVATDNTAALREDPARNAAILDRIPAARWGEPDDFAGVAVFLASRASDYVHGALIPVDGGWLGR
jgi:2-dehydro-3-deoxy-D-gluconate 5-dehydrogenase